MNIVAWIVLGAMAGYLAGFAIRGDESFGFIGHIALGIVGALIGGALAQEFLGIQHPIEGPFELRTVLISVAGAVITIAAVNVLRGRRRFGSGLF